MEIIFFQDIGLLSRLLGYEPSQDMLTSAVFQPCKTLEKLLSKSKKYDSYSQVIDQLTNEDLGILRQTPFIQELIYFLQSVQKTATVNF
jgi:hypothetical protein